jgi:acyl-CoA thioesterase
MKTPEEIINIMMEGDAFSRWMGVEIEKLGLGYCTMKAIITPEMLNGFGIAHGGISYSLADSTLAFASNSRGIQCVSIETSISHVKKIQLNDILKAEAKELHRGEKTGIYEVNVTNQRSELVAIFKGSVFITGKEW